MENKIIQSRRVVHLKREAVIGLFSSILSVYIVLPYLNINKHWKLSELYLELFTTPMQILVYLLLAILMLVGHLLLTGTFYYVRSFSTSNVKSIMINQFIYGITIAGFAYYYCSRPSKHNANIFERFIHNKETFYVIVFFILFYWIGNMIYFNSRFHKKLELA